MGPGNPHISAFVNAPSAVHPLNLRLRREMRLESIKDTIENWDNHIPTDGQISMSIRKKALVRNIRNFIWKNIHGAYKVGNYWLNIPGYENRENCASCDCEEPPEHILTECRALGQEHLWSLAKTAWLSTGRPWPRIYIGIILGCDMASYKNNNNDKPHARHNRLFQI
jgi:hypothetical protein